MTSSFVWNQALLLCPFHQELVTVQFLFIPPLLPYLFRDGLKRLRVGCLPKHNKTSYLFQEIPFIEVLIVWLHFYHFCTNYEYSSPYILNFQQQAKLKMMHRPFLQLAHGIHVEDRSGTAYHLTENRKQGTIVLQWDCVYFHRDEHDKFCTYHKNTSYNLLFYIWSWYPYRIGIHIHCHKFEKKLSL